MNIQDTLKKYKLVPVVVLKTIADAEYVLEALCDGGLPVAEITFRTECASEAISLARAKYPQMLVGAGTVINAKQAEKAIASGAQFIVSPGIADDVADICAEKNVLYIPGCLSPTDIIHAINLGLKTVKFFPAESYGGIKTIKAISAAFPGITFMPTGGINPDNITAYLEHDFILACGGSFMIKKTYEQTYASVEEAVKLIERL